VPQLTHVRFEGSAATGFFTAEHFSGMGFTGHLLHRGAVSKQGSEARIRGQNLIDTTYGRSTIPVSDPAR